MNFIDFWNKGKFDTNKVLLSLTLVFFAYFVGSSFLYIDLAFNFPDYEIIGNDYVKNLSLLLGKNRLLLWLLLPFIFVFAALIGCLYKIHKLPLVAIFTSREKIDWNRSYFAFSLWGVMVVGVTLIELLLHRDFEIIFNLQRFLPLFFLALLIVPIQTTTEELLFRGYILQGIKKRTGSYITAILTSGVMFGMMHIANPEILKMGYHILIYYVAVGVVLGFIVYYDSGLELAMGFHAANNLITALLITSDWQAFQTDAILKDNHPPGNGVTGILMASVMLCLFFYIVMKKYKWAIFSK